MGKLESAIANLLAWQKSELALGHSLKSRCLEATRHALELEGISLPAPNNTAFANFEALSADPGKYGLVQVHTPLPEYALVYFKDCGWIGTGDDRRQAGHVGILHDGVIYGNQDYPWGSYWADRIVGGFVPVGE